MPPNASEDDESRIYIVRLSEPAEAEVDAAYLRLILHTRQDDHWELREVKGMDGSVYLSSVGDSLAMTDIYPKIKFKPEQS